MINTSIIQRSTAPIVAVLFTLSAIAQPDTWTQLAEFGSNPRTNASSFSIGTKGYLGAGANLLLGMPHLQADFWEYDPALNTWTAKAYFIGGARSRAVGFSIGNKGYFCGGNDGTSDRKDLWQYDPVADLWTEKTSCGGPSRSDAVAFSIGNKGYVGLGMDSVYNALSDIWEYDPATDTWTQLADFGGSARGYATAFTIGNYAYVGLGGEVNTYVNDFWRYDPAGDTWLQVASYPGNGRHEPIGFSIGTKGYAGTGWDAVNVYQDFLEYDPLADGWASRANYMPGVRSGCAAFSVGTKGYAGTGRGTFLQLYQDFFSYEPDPGGSGIPTPFRPDASLDLFPSPVDRILHLTSPSKAEVEVFDDAGGRVRSATVVRGSVALDVSTLPPGLYSVVLRDDAKAVCGRFVKQ